MIKLRTYFYPSKHNKPADNFPLSCFLPSHGPFSQNAILPWRMVDRWRRSLVQQRRTPTLSLSTACSGRLLLLLRRLIPRAALYNRPFRIPLKATTTTNWRVSVSHLHLNFSLLGIRIRLILCPYSSMSNLIPIFSFSHLPRPLRPYRLIIYYLAPIPILPRLPRSPGLITLCLRHTLACLVLDGC